MKAAPAFGPYDYSYAGYALCPEAVAERDGPFFPVREHGAVPDDGQSDREAVQAAINAAAAAGGGVVLFESGRYLLNEKTGHRKGLKVQGEGVVLRGVRASGDTPPTVLFMRHHLEPADPKKKWTTPPLFEFTPKGRPARPVLTRVAADAAQGDFTLTVHNASRVQVGQFVNLEMQNPEANPTLLGGLKPWKIWTQSNEKGIAVRGERHRVVAVQGNTVTFAEPLHIDVVAAHGWEVKAAPMTPGWCVEDLTFEGDCPEPFVHHKNAKHDSGWSILSFQSGYGPALRRCVFRNTTSAASFNRCYGATAIDNVIEGRQGHHAISSGNHSYGTLIAFCQDVTRGGSFHGFAANAGAVGTVIHRSKNSDTGFDWHASGPYTTLIDACTGGLVGNGGNVTLLPNHLHGLTFWNFKQTSGPAYDRMNWWEPRQAKEQYSGPKIVRPRMVGYHGIRSTFAPRSCLSIESHGKPVQPASLFAAQLAKRLGSLPTWMTQRPASHP